MSFKGYKHTEEVKQKISEARKKRMAEQGFLNSPETRQKISIARILSRKQPKPTRRGHPKGHSVWNWKGDDVGYHALHSWINRELGAPSQCSRCGSTTAKKYEWANISGEYKRDLSDWVRLCVSCHRKEGYQKGEYTVWLKGTHTQTNTGRTHFPKGHVPANKYLENKNCPICGNEFRPRLAKIKYCSRKCYWKSMVTDKET